MSHPDWSNSRPTPIAALFLKLGILPIQYEIETRQLVFLKRILDRENDDPVKMSYEADFFGGWWSVVGGRGRGSVVDGRGSVVSGRGSVSVSVVGGRQWSGVGGRRSIVSDRCQCINIMYSYYCCCCYCYVYYVCRWLCNT